MHVDDAIFRQVESREIRDQSVLLALLREEGFELTLSTLSRRMKKLNIRKDRGLYRPVQATTARPKGAPLSLRKVQPCLILIRTHVGTAQALAVALDDAQLPSLAGSVAGHDTIFLAAVEPSRLDALEEEIRRHLGFYA